MDSSWRTAITATRHCLTGCAIGEVLGMVIATAAGWGNAASIAISVVLAFFFGYLLTFLGVRRSGLPVAAAVRVALAADTVSILVMEIVDNALLLAWPSAMDAGLADLLFWGSLAIALAVAFVVTVPGQPGDDRARPGPREGARAPREPRALATRGSCRSAQRQPLSDSALAAAVVGRAGTSVTGRTGLVPPRIMCPTYPFGGYGNHHRKG